LLFDLGAIPSPPVLQIICQLHTRLYYSSIETSFAKSWFDNINLQLVKAVVGLPWRWMKRVCQNYYYPITFNFRCI
jgi:hypothetical protein